MATWSRAEELLRVKLGSKAGKAAVARSPLRASSPRRVDGTTGALVEVNCETDFVTQERFVPGLRQGAAPSWSRRNDPADVAALSALPTAQDGFGPTRRGRAQGPDRQDRREHVDPPLQALRRRRPARAATCTARASACWSSTRATRSRRRTSRCTSRR